MMNHTWLTWLWPLSRVLVMYAVFFVAVAVNADITKCFGQASDGASWIHLFQYSAQLGRDFSASAADPIQGLFDASNSGVNHFAFSTIASGFALFGVYSSAFMVAGLVTFFALSVVYFLWAFDLLRSFRAEAGLIAALVLFVPIGLVSPHECMILSVKAISPHIAYILAMSLITVASFKRISASPRSIPHGFVAAACLFFLFYEFPLSTALLAIFVFSVGASCILFSRSRSEAIAKIVAGGALGLVLIATGTFSYVLSFGSYLDIYAFPADLQGAGWAGGSLVVPPEFKNFRDDFIQVVFAVNPHVASIDYFKSRSVLMYMAVIACLFMIVAPNRRNERIIACALFLSLLLCFLLYFVTHYFGYFFSATYTGPDPYHFTYAHWSLAVITILLGLASIWHRLTKRTVGSVVQRHALPLRAATAVLIACAPVVMAVPISGTWEKPRYESLLAYDFKALWEKPYLSWEARPNPITDRLKADIGLTTDSERFRGRVVTVAAKSPEYEKCLRDHGYYNETQMIANEFQNDSFLTVFSELRNEMRHAGLWAHNIPTLYQVTGTRAADLYLFMSAFMAGPKVNQVRTYFVIDQLPQSILRMIGIRYSITDFALQAEPVVQLDVGPVTRQIRKRSVREFLESCGSTLSRTLYLNSLNNVNLGQYAPRRWQRAEDALDALTIMNRRDFDPEKLGIYFGGREPVVGPMPDKASIFFEDGYLRIEVTADGPTTLLLPVQFSNCWEVLGEQAQNRVRLFRANLLLTGAEVTGTTQFTLSLTHRPFFKHGCRREDGNDFRRLGVGQEALDRFRAASE